MSELIELASGKSEPTFGKAKGFGKGFGKSHYAVFSGLIWQGQGRRWLQRRPGAGRPLRRRSRTGREEEPPSSSARALVGRLRVD